IKNDEAEREWDHPARRTTDPGRLDFPAWPHGRPLAPGHDQKRMNETQRSDDSDEDAEQGPARLQYELVVYVQNRVEPDQRQQQPEGDDCGHRSIAAGAHEIEAQYRLTRHIKLSPRQAGRANPAAGRSW